MTSASDIRDATLDALSRVPHAKERCVAPLYDSDDPRADVLCGKKATSYRFVDPVIAPLCAAHAAEWDLDVIKEANAKSAYPIATARNASAAQSLGASRGKRPVKRRSTRRS